MVAPLAEKKKVSLFFELFFEKAKATCHVLVVLFYKAAA
jgi:hypothetical protein